MPMRKTRTRARRLHTGPTSRPSDLVCLLFSRRNCDAASDFVQALFVRRFKTKIRHLSRPEVSTVSPAKENVRAEDC